MKTPQTKIFIASIILVLICLSATILYASPPHNQQHFFKTRHLINLIDFFTDLELTQEQKDAFRELLTDTHYDIKPLIEEMHALRTEMDELLREEEIDTAVIEKKILDLASLKSSMTAIALTAKLDGAQILTPEQRESIFNQKVVWKERFLRWRNLLAKLFVDWRTR